MLKWLLCLLWGHNFDRETEHDKKTILKEFTCSYGMSKDYKVMRFMWCIRCQKYRKV